MILWKEFFSKVIEFKKIEKRSLLGNAFLLKHNQYRPGKYGVLSESESEEVLLLALLLSALLLLSEDALLSFLVSFEEDCSVELLLSFLIDESKSDIDSDESSN